MRPDGKAVGILGCLLNRRRIFSLQHSYTCFAASRDISDISNTSKPNKLPELAIQATFLIVERLPL